RGCAFINTMAEMSDRTSAAHRAAAGHKARFQDLLAKLLREAGLDQEHAADLLLLFDGAVAAAVREGSTAPALRARRLAAALLGVPNSRPRKPRARASRK